jgi:hypothetical protein
MVVMEPLENDFKPCDEFNELSDSLMKAVSTSLDRFHALGSARFERVRAQTYWPQQGHVWTRR